MKTMFTYANVRYQSLMIYKRYTLTVISVPLCNQRYWGL